MARSIGYRSLLVPLADNAETDQALDVACRLAAEHRASITAVAVIEVPQVLPLVAAGVAWTWMYSSNGLVNQILRALGLGGTTRAWLGDFTTALPAVGMIG